MSVSRKGKIARLSYEHREELCRRLRDGQSVSTINAWLVSAGVPGAPFNDQNFTNWRQGGYSEWIKEQERLDRIRATAESTRRQVEAQGGALYDRVAFDYAQALADLRSSAADEKAISRLAGATAALLNAATARQRAATDARRAELAEKSLELAREKFEEQRARNAQAVEKLKAVAAAGGITPETLKTIEETMQLL